MLLALLLASMFVASVNVRFVKADGTIYIRADGSIDPPTAPISTGDNATYTFTDSIYDEIVIERDDIVVDGMNYSLRGTGYWDSRGVYLFGRNNVTIKNVEIEAFGVAVRLSNSSNNRVFGNVMTNNSYGVVTQFSENDWISGNAMSGGARVGSYGIFSDGSGNASIIGNNITACELGIRLFGAIDHTLVQNNIMDCIESGIEVESSSNNTISMNNFTSNGNHGIYLHFGSSGNNISLNSVRATHNIGIAQYNAGPNDMFDNRITGNAIGVLGCSRLFANEISDNNIGIMLDGAGGAMIFENNVTENTQYGIRLQYSHLNLIYRNNFVNNGEQASVYGYELQEYPNQWDNGYACGGNFWSDYAGNDSNDDGIGDTPYMIRTYNVDMFPLIAPYDPMTQCYTFHLGDWGNAPYYVQIASNSTVSNLAFAADSATMSFNVSDNFPAVGYCRIEFKNALLEGPYTIWVNTTEVSPTTTTDGTNSFLYFTYLQNTYTISVIGTKAIPESSPILILPLFMIATLLAVIAYKRKHT